MADISSITLPGGGTYNLKDKNAVPRYGKGVNLLRNWYFKNPVNQRGNTSGMTTINAYFLDGWKTTYGTASGTWALISSGLQVISAANTYAVIMQNVEDALLNGFALTASALYSDGTINTATLASRVSGTSQYFGSGVSWQLDENGVLRRRVYGTQTIVAIKLELGTEQTLAHQENGVWVLNDIPDYEYELYRCITSTADSSDTYANKSLATEQQLAYVETGTTASRAYAVGEYFCWNGLLYRVISAISSGAAFTVGTNCEQVTDGGFNAFLPSITNGTVTTEKASGFVQTFSVAGLYFTYFKITTSVVASVTDVLATVPAAYSPLSREVPVEFLYQRPTDSAPIIRGDRAGIWLDANGEIMQRLSNSWPANTLMQGLFIYTR